MRALALSMLTLLACTPAKPSGEGSTPPTPHGDAEKGHEGHGAEQGHMGHEGHQGHQGHQGHKSGSVHHRFDDAEKWAKVFDDPARDAWQKPDAVVAWLELSEGDVVADLGAGTGYFAVRIARAVNQGKVLANDIEPEMVRYLAQRAQREGLDNLLPVQGTASRVGFADETTVNLVFVCDVYHHIADRSAFFAGLATSLAPGGRIVIVDFDPAAPADAPGPPPAMRLSTEQVTSELAKAGFVLGRRDDDTLPYQYMLEFSRAAN